jgi:hypothetical protein
MSELLNLAYELLGERPSNRILTVREWLIIKNKNIIQAAISASPEMKDMYQDLRCVLGEENANMEMIALLTEKLKNGTLKFTIQVAPGLLK